MEILSSESDSEEQVVKYSLVDLKKLNQDLKSNQIKWANKYQNIQLMGEIKTPKLYYSFTIFDLNSNGECFKCVIYRNIKIKSQSEYNVFGNIVMGRYGLQMNVHKIEQIKKSISHLDIIKTQADKLGYFKNKKSIDFDKINRITIISKINTQGYNDFIEQFKVPIKLKLINVCLEGEKTKTDIINAIENSQNSDAIIIIRGGGQTTDISLSFDCLELFKSIKNSKIPVLTSIGHYKDSNDQLLITRVSDMDFPTPSTAASEMSKYILNPLIEKKIQQILRFQKLVKNRLNQLNSNFNRYNYTLLNKLNEDFYNIKKKLKPKKLDFEFHNINLNNSNIIYIKKNNKIIKYRLTPLETIEIDIELFKSIDQLDIKDKCLFEKLKNIDIPNLQKNIIKKIKKKYDDYNNIINIYEHVTFDLKYVNEQNLNKLRKLLFISENKDFSNEVDYANILEIKRLLLSFSEFNISDINVNIGKYSYSLDELKEDIAIDCNSDLLNIIDQYKYLSHLF